MKRTEIQPEDPGARFGQTMRSVVVPRPIAWVSSLSARGTANLAPHSFFTVASDHPPIVQFTSMGRKDSVTNIAETGEFVINFASEPDFEAVNATGTDYPPEADEFEETGIAREPAATVAPPRVASSPAAIECRLERMIEVGDGTLVLGRVTLIAIASTVLRDGRADIELLRPLARLGGIQWALLGEIREIRRIPYRELSESVPPSDR